MIRKQRLKLPLQLQRQLQRQRQLKPKLKLLMTLLAVMLLGQFGISFCYAGDFLGERYRWWLWFEEKQQGREVKKPKREARLNPQAKLTISNKSNEAITYEQAKAEIEQFRQELEERRFMMLARPTVENVALYRAKEKQMWDKAMIIHEAWEMENLLYPEQRDLLNNPVNVHAVKAKREIGRENEQKKLKELAERFELVLFFQGSCKYCQLLSPVLYSFGSRYGFNISAVSIDGSKHELFESRTSIELVKRLGIEAVPTVIAVSHDSKVAFELTRGYVSGAELEEYGALAVDYLRSSGKWLDLAKEVRAGSKS